jgi:hypothetical protein
LLAGNYQLRLESAGFAAFLANATVQVDSTTRIDATMAPAGKQTEIAVTTETPLLVSDRAEIATTLTGREIQALPVLDRNVTQTHTGASPRPAQFLAARHQRESAARD